jgi:uroporphyrin-3 C-methyltransferase
MTETANRPDSDTAEPAGGEPAAERGESAPEGFVPPATTSVRPRAGLLALIAVFALVLSLLATTMAGFLWWQYREFYVSLDAADGETERVLAGVRDGLARADDRIDSLRAVLDADRARGAVLAERLDALPTQLATLEQRIAASQGGSLEARSAWLRAEAEYYLGVANTELEIAGNWEAAITALEIADRSLDELANPALRPVRELIADELIALRSVRLPDIDGLAFSLSRLAERAAGLPIRAGTPANGAAGPTFDDAEPGLGRLWIGIKNAFADIIRVERSDQPVARVLTAEERRLVERQLVLELQLARIAALRGEAQAFEASLETAIGLLRRDFDPATPEVEGAIELLEQMATLELAPAKPDISTSLNRLRAIPAGDI